MAKRRNRPRAEDDLAWSKINIRERLDLDLPGYAVARDLQATSDQLGLKYLHLTPIENVEAILRDGLRSESRMIFFVDNAFVVGHVALNQVFTQEFALFGVRHGKSWRFVNDSVAEMISDHQWIYRAEAIGPEKLVDLGRYRAVPPYDQFEPYPPEAFEKFPKDMPEEEKDRLLARLERGRWPSHALAYIERIDGTK